MPILDLGAAATPGRRVTVTVPTATLSRLAAMVFAVPLVALVGGAWAGSLAAAGLGLTTDAAAAATGLAALALALLLVARRGDALVRELKLDARVHG